MEAGGRFVKGGCWDSIHVVEVIDNPKEGKAVYKLTTTVMLAMIIDKDAVGEANLSGSLTRQIEKSSKVCMYSFISHICVYVCVPIITISPPMYMFLSFAS